MSDLYTLSGIFFQAGGTGPKIGRWHHFDTAAPKKIPNDIGRYAKEPIRLLKELDHRLKDRDFLADAYSIADVMNFTRAKAGLRDLPGSGDLLSLSAWVDRVGEAAKEAQS